MAKLTLRGLVFASFCLAVAACGGDDGGSGLVLGVDAGDGGSTGATCNPVNQTGCADGEKCASVTIQENPLIVSTLCVPNGTQAEGETCEAGAAGATTGYDNCQAALECVFGECRPTCAAGGGTVAGTCEGEFVCQRFTDLFEDVDGDVGLCIPMCDPTLYDPADYTGDMPTGSWTDPAQCGDSGLQCFMNAFGGYGICAGGFMGAPGNYQDCGDSCSLNGCAPGHGPFKPTGSLAETGENGWWENSNFSALNIDDTCVQYCTPSKWTNAGGDPLFNDGAMPPVAIDMTTPPTPAPAPGAFTDNDGVAGADYSGGCSATGEPFGGAPGAYECRFLTGMVIIDFENLGYAPESFASGGAFGVCIDTADFGTCEDHVLDDIQEYFADRDPQTDPNPFDPVSSDNNFVPGCVSGTLAIARADQLIAMQMMNFAELTSDKVAGLLWTQKRLEEMRKQLAQMEAQMRR